MWPQFSHQQVGNHIEPQRVTQFSKCVLNAAFKSPCTGFWGRSEAEEETDTGRERHTEKEREMRMNVKENERKKTDQSIKELPIVVVAELAIVVVAELAAAATAAKLLQSCLTLCSPIDGNPPGSPVPGILQARTLEWVAISFSRQNWLHTYIFIAQPV